MVVENFHTSFCSTCPSFAELDRKVVNVGLGWKSSRCFSKLKFLYDRLNSSVLCFIGSVAWKLYRLLSDLD